MLAKNLFPQRLNRNPVKIAKSVCSALLILTLTTTMIQNANAYGGHSSQASDSSSLPTSAFADDMVDGASFVDKMLQSAESYQDYTFDYTMKVFKDRKTVVESGVFYFKKPRLIRLEETGEYKHGAVACLGPSGKVQAHLGGGLKLFVVEL